MIVKIICNLCQNIFHAEIFKSEISESFAVGDKASVKDL